MSKFVYHEATAPMILWKVVVLLNLK